MHGDQFSYEKPDPKGHACAFLGYEESTTRSFWVAYRKKSGGLSVTLVDAGQKGEAAHWARRSSGRVEMAFRFVQRDLRVLSEAWDCPDKDEGESVGDAAQQIRSSIGAAPLVAAPRDVPVAGQHSQPSPSWINPNSSCPACRGRHRTHVYSGSCRFAGLSLELVEKIKHEIRTLNKSDRLAMFEVARKAVIQGSDPLVAIQQHRKSSNVRMHGHARAASHNPVSRASESTPEATPSAVGSNVATRAPSSALESVEAVRAAAVDSSATKAPVSCALESSGGALAAAAGSDATKNSAKPPREIQMLGLHSQDQASGHSDDARHVISQGETQPSPEFLSYLDSCNLSHDSDSASRHNTCMQTAESPSVFLTRKMSRAEKCSAQGQEANRAELYKLAVTYKAIDIPISREEAAALFPHATISALILLSFIKGVEKPLSDHIFKGRAVVLGDRIFLLSRSDGAAVSSAEWSVMTSQLAALEEGRLVDAHAIVHGYNVESVDIEAAYLQEPWPADLPAHFVQIPAELWPLLPPHLRPTVDADDKGVRNPVWRMTKCIYGHPLSGHIFVSGCLKFLIANGWVSVGKFETGALLKKENTLCCIYVDDVKASGPASELAALWSLMESRYPLKESIRDTSEFLGIHQKLVHDSCFSSIEYSMTNYCKEIVHVFSDTWGFSPKPSFVPIAPDAQLRLVPDQISSSAPQKRVQKMIGMLLWLSRTGRPDLSMAASLLGSRVATWDGECDRELARCVGYIAVTAGMSLRLAWRRGDTVKAALYTDADWHGVRSQSGSFFCLQGSDSKSFIPLFWKSTKQRTKADSAAAAESMAGYAGIKNSWPIFDSCKQVFGLSGPLSIFMDNKQVLSLARNGSSDKLFFAFKAANLRMGLLRELAENQFASFSHVRSANQKADIFTKSLSRIMLERNCESIGLLVDRVTVRRDELTACFSNTASSFFSFLQQRYLYIFF